MKESPKFVSVMVNGDDDGTQSAGESSISAAAAGKLLSEYQASSPKPPQPLLELKVSFVHVYVQVLEWVTTPTDLNDLLSNNNNSTQLWRQKCEIKVLRNYAYMLIVASGKGFAIKQIQKPF